MTKTTRLSAAENVLDRPIWYALNSRLSHLAQRAGTALMMAQDVSPMAAPKGFEQDDLQDFQELVLRRDTTVVTLERENFPALSSQVIQEVRPCVQLVARMPSPPKQNHITEALGPQDAAEMLALAELTKPGPFARNTHRLGDFIGIKKNGKLIAMAGQRLQVPGFTEVSAVCVLPAFQGQGIGAELVRQMSAHVVRQGHVPFLHSYEDNTGAIRMYESLGFEIRARLMATMWSKPTAQSS